MDFFFNYRQQERTDGSQLLFERNSVLLQRNPMLDDVCIICFQVTIFPCKDISKIFYQAAKFRPLTNSQPSGQIYQFWMALASYVLLLDSRIQVIFGRLERDVIVIKQFFQWYQTSRYVVVGKLDNVLISHFIFQLEMLGFLHVQVFMVYVHIREFIYQLK